ncbi:MAG: DEAD/DEAH box helicase [Chloroflexi bacterium]|nr:DEAD/DEAH box helicase [Chloroflexota bacterium]
MSFDTLGLQPELLRAVAEQGYTEPTPVQVQAIPHVLAGRDVLAGAQTGTGKTAAFVLPILQLLQANRPAPRHSIGKRPKGATGLPIRCLVLVPTRELALQVEESVRTYGQTRPVRSAAVYGGVGYAPQIEAIRGGPEILLATPGRLLDHAGEGIVDLSKVEILVLDEADRMLDMGFIRDIRRIIGLLPARRQNLLFSATFSDDIRSLSNSILRDPAQIQVAKRNSPVDLVRQVAIRVDRERKRDLLRELWASERIDQALVFVRSKHGAGRLAEQLQRDGIPAAAIHGDRTQSQRIRALDDFKEGRVDILVATEVAARGLDIEGLPHVVNYELPLVPEDYIHRIGRTGRAGAQGDAISLVASDEFDLLDNIERLLGLRIPIEIVEGFEPHDRARAPRSRGRGELVRAGTGRSGPSRGGSGQGGSAHGSGVRARPPRRSESGRAPAPNGGGPRPMRARTARIDAPAAPRPTSSRPQSDGRGFTTMPGERFANRGPSGG